MKKLAIVALLVLAGCRRHVSVGSPSANPPGGATPREALRLFMAAAKSQDVQAMSNVWGTSAGPAHTTMGREELEQREIIMMPCLKHDSYQVLGEAPGQGGERVLAVEIKYQDLTRPTNFTATRGPSERWYIKSLNLEALNEICPRRS